MHKDNQENKKSLKHDIASSFKKVSSWVDGDEVQLETPVAVNVPKIKKPSPHPFLEKRKKFQRFYIGMSIFLCCALIAVLLYTVSGLPNYGEVDVPTNNEVAEKYIVDGLEDTGATSIIAGMILDYRAFDTLGESSVLFIAVSAVIILLKRDPDCPRDRQQEEENRRNELLIKSQPNIVLKTVGKIMVPFILIFGCYVVLNGHISPGGGFSGGAVMGAALILLAASNGFSLLDKFFNFKLFTAITSGALLCYACCKAYSFFTGANHLESFIPKGIPGAILSGGFILPLNICVGMIVACTMYGFYSLFSRGDL